VLKNNAEVRKQRRWWSPNRWAYVPGYGDDPAALLDALDRERIPYKLYSSKGWPYPK
jgi:hypothetical protein